MLSTFGHCGYCAAGQTPIVQLYVMESALTDYAADYARCWFSTPKERICFSWSHLHQVDSSRRPQVDGVDLSALEL